MQGTGLSRESLGGWSSGTVGVNSTGHVEFMERSGCSRETLPPFESWIPAPGAGPFFAKPFSFYLEWPASSGREKKSGEKDGSAATVGKKALGRARRILELIWPRPILRYRPPPSLFFPFLTFSIPLSSLPPPPVESSLAVLPSAEARNSSREFPSFCVSSHVKFQPFALRTRNWIGTGSIYIYI